jgi:CRP/FNR family transcriptional regulator/CRP/FNR family cyclic AMP-dependent transcriptional regulator
MTTATFMPDPAFSTQWQQRGMTLALDHQTLDRSFLLRGLPRDRLELLDAVGRRRTYRRGQVLFERGDEGRTVHVLCRGRVKVVVPTWLGDEAVVGIRGPGELLGEMALLDDQPRSATAVALEDVTTLTLGRDEFRRLLRDHPAAAEALLAALAGTIRRLNEQVSDLMFLDVRGRLAKKLLELAAAHGRASGGGVEIGIRLTQEDLAGMIGSTRQRVSAALGFYEDRGMLARRGRYLVISQPAALGDSLGQ